MVVDILKSIFLTIGVAFEGHASAAHLNRRAAEIAQRVETHDEMAKVCSDTLHKMEITDPIQCHTPNADSDLPIETEPKEGQAPSDTAVPSPIIGEALPDVFEDPPEARNIVLVKMEL